jgi:cytochrome c oxidase accessory protein FixG
MVRIDAAMEEPVEEEHRGTASRGTSQASAHSPPAANEKPILVVESLYAKRKEIYPRARIGDSMGWFQRWRWALVWVTQIVFYGLPWLTWNDRQAVLFDLAARKFYLFTLVLWPQDVIYLSALLIISALSLFLFTAVGGRLWCGYACPQTVYSEIFMWIERVIEGDRARRMKLDQQPMSPRKFALKIAKHAVWIVFALWTGFTFVGFFTPIRELGHDLLALQIGGWSAFWILFYGFATYGNAGWLREQVCLYMCPYARFQSAMFDDDTLTVTYDATRGEPRGVGSKRRTRQEAGLGNCVDCKLCVQVCPTGIDIRDGLQYECIGCAACIDACNYVMDKAGMPRGLIRYATANGIAQHLTASQVWARVFRPRVLIYGGVLVAITVAVVGALAIRVPLKVDVIRDRGELARETDDGHVENVYRLQVINATETPQRYTIKASGLPGLAIASDAVFSVPAATTQSIPLRLRARESDVAPGSHPIVIEVVSQQDAAIHVREKTIFRGVSP